MTFAINMKFLSLVLLVLLAVESSYSSRYRYRNRYWGRFTKSCKDYYLPSNAEWVPGSNGVKSFKCSEGFELIVKVYCYYGKWYHKFVCVPVDDDETTPVPTTTDSDPVQCDDNPSVPNGQLDGEVSSTDVGATVNFTCNSGFTLNGRAGTLTCSASGMFEPDFPCEDCTGEDMVGQAGGFQEVTVVTEDDCTDLCNGFDDCSSTFDPTTGSCTLDFTIGTDLIFNLADCRQNCFAMQNCMAFTFNPTLTTPCTFFAKPFDSFTVVAAATSSTCL